MWKPGCRPSITLGNRPFAPFKPDLARKTGFLETDVPYSRQGSGARLATAFVGFTGEILKHQTFAVEIQTLLVVVSGPLSFECLCLCGRGNTEPPRRKDHRSNAHLRLGHRAAESALGAGENRRRNLSFGPDPVQHGIQRIAQFDERRARHRFSPLAPRPGQHLREPNLLGISLRHGEDDSFQHILAPFWELHHSGCSLNRSSSCDASGKEESCNAPLTLGAARIVSESPTNRPQKGMVVRL